MTKVAIAGVHALAPASYWDKDLGDLVIDAASPLLEDAGIDGLFCAGGDPFGWQGDIAALAADRLGLEPLIAFAYDGADIGGADAIYAAWLHVKTGLCNRALVLGAAKVSDVSESERYHLLDRTLDHDAEVARGIDFAAQAGLLAGEYCRLRGAGPDVFAATTAANLAAWAQYKGRPKPTIAEVRRDLPVAPPLVRSDFAQLLDGACALLLTPVDQASSTRAIIKQMGQGTDILSVWERRDPLAFEAASRATMRALGDTCPHRLEVDAGVSVAQRLTEDAVVRAVAANTKMSAAFAPRVNARGGSQGRGRVFGASPLYQIADAAETITQNEIVLALAVSGLGTNVVATLIEGVP